MKAMKRGENMKRKSIPAALNMSTGLIPVILCMILSEFILDEYALYISAIVGVVYSYFSFCSSRKKIFNFILYGSTLCLLLMSATTFFPFHMFPRGTVPLTLEVVIILLMAFIFYGQKILKSLFSIQRFPKIHLQLIASLDSAIVSARIIFIMGVIHFIITSIAIVIIYPLDKNELVFLYHILPPVFLVLDILLNQIVINFANRVIKKEEMIPIVNKQGDVIGRRLKVETKTYKNAFINPIIRIAFICNSMLLLCTRKSTCVTEKSKVDIPLEGYLQFGERPEECVNRLMAEAFPNGTSISPRFSIKHHFKNDDTNRLVYLYIAYVDDESLLANFPCPNSKLWTFHQIEENLDKNFFSQCFEGEYEHLKESALIWEEFK